MGQNLDICDNKHYQQDQLEFRETPEFHMSKLLVRSIGKAFRLMFSWEMRSALGILVPLAQFNIVYILCLLDHRNQSWRRLPCHQTGIHFEAFPSSFSERKSMQ